MRALIIALVFIMLSAGAAFAKSEKDAYERGFSKKDGKYAQPHVMPDIPGKKRNDNKPTNENENQQAGQSNPTWPDPYDSKYNKGYNRPRY